ncbi:DUF2493 domain-containing protein [Blastochloris sulfoviridis]|uniref:DUF2493 domain-containing protein n=2 Tax=Blastochloris sulfoviridis TaxID=50712 RepID=A0A5M6HHV3_9HYPH|nr:DUF2493 domain-containing protein [Blastochloris sulfoviridis]
MLSLRLATPALPMIAALSASHLAAMLFPATLRRLYIARDADPAGDGAAETLTTRATAAGIEAIILSPHRDDFNADLRALGLDELRSHVRTQLVPEDVARFADIFDALIVALRDTRLEPDLDDLLWSTVNLFHRAVQRIERSLDDNEQAQRRSQTEQDGSEVRSVELERLIAEGVTLIERRNAMEAFRDHAADLFERHTHSAWRPRAGSLASHRTLTAAMIDSRDFLAAKRRTEAELMMPAGPKVAFTGGADFNDHHLIWDRLDKVQVKHPDMVLLHGGSPKGAERIAARWADTRKVPQIAFKPDWTRHGKAAPFKRNDQMLAVLPIGVLVFPGSGIQHNLADKAKMLGIPVWKFGRGA